MKICAIDAFQIYDSRGVPTVEAVVVLENGTAGHGLVPSGASTGQFEALERRDTGSARFRGKAVFQAVGNIKDVIAPELLGRDAGDQRAIDETLIELDGTPGKSRLGANALLGVSMAVAVAAARAKNLPLHVSLGPGATLPLPEIQIFGGGLHANRRCDVQDFLIMAVGAESYDEALEMTFAVYHAAGDIMRETNRFRGVADEGGYWPEFQRNEEAFEFLLRAIDRCGYVPGVDIAISLDIAASDLYDAVTRLYRFSLDGREFDSEAFSELLLGWCAKYPIVSIEDPLADVDVEGWGRMFRAIGDRIQLVGDDLFTTNVARIRQGIAGNLANAVLIKLNQVGTVTETMDAVRLAQSAGWAPIVSARSGETEDAFISHLAVAVDAGQLKVGSFARSERMAKWNEILRIARHLGDRARFPGAAVLPGRTGTPSCGREFVAKRGETTVRPILEKDRI